MSSRYRDRWIECSDDGIEIRGYYFPWGTKHIRLRLHSFAEQRSSSARSEEEQGSGDRPIPTTGRASTHNGRTRASASSSIWAGTCGPS